jgi:hypothetical protein
MKELVKEMEDRSILVNNSPKPPKHRERWLAAMEATRTPETMTIDELRDACGEDLATWYEK